MCIIIAKDKNIDRVPTIEEVTQSFKYNSDGSGFMYVDNGKVIIDKGYMKLDKFIERYKYLLEKFNNFKNKSLVIHCRIGTSSGNTPENTHPYPITRKEKELHKLQFSCDLGMVHNGIIRDYTPKNLNSTTNDTQEFILRYLNPLYENWREFYKNTAIRNGLEDITSSKLVFLDTNDKLYYVGDFIEDNGIKFSNGTYKMYTPTFSSSYKFGCYNNYMHDYDDYNYYQDKFYEDEKYDDLLEDEYLLPLADDWYVEYNGNVAQVGDKALVYDLYAGSLYKLSDNNTLIHIASNVSVYDEKYELVN